MVRLIKWYMNYSSCPVILLLEMRSNNCAKLRETAISSRNALASSWMGGGL
jgi:hypothetical protein